MHRVGRNQPLTRRCLSEPEILAAGLKLNGKGQWRIVADAERAATLKAACEIRIPPVRATRAPRRVFPRPVNAQSLSGWHGRLPAAGCDDSEWEKIMAAATSTLYYGKGANKEQQTR